MRRRTLLAATLALGAWSPDRPIRFIQGFAPGGTTDILARLLAPELAAALGQPVVVENRPGAGRTLAAEALARARPDGSTMMLLNNGFAAAAALFQRLPYDPEADVTPAAMVATMPLVLLAAPNGAADLAAFLAAARARPEAINVATVGVGSTQHFALAALAAMAGIQVTHVPYRGTPAALVALRNGEVQAVMETLGAVLGQVQAGEVRPLGVTTAARSALLPAVPTIAEQGVVGFELATWYAIGFPAGTPDAVQERVAAETARAVERLAPRLAELGLAPAPAGPAATRAMVATEIARARALQARAGIPQQ